MYVHLLRKIHNIFQCSFKPQFSLLICLQLKKFSKPNQSITSPLQRNQTKPSHFQSTKFSQDISPPFLTKNLSLLSSRTKRGCTLPKRLPPGVLYQSSLVDPVVLCSSITIGKMLPAVSLCVLLSISIGMDREHKKSTEIINLQENLYNRCISYFRMSVCCSLQYFVTALLIIYGLWQLWH